MKQHYCSIIFLIIRILFSKFKQREREIVQKKYFSYHFLLNELFRKHSIEQNVMEELIQCCFTSPKKKKNCLMRDK